MSGAQPRKRGLGEQISREQMSFSGLFRSCNPDLAGSNRISLDRIGSRRVAFDSQDDPARVSNRWVRFSETLRPLADFEPKIMLGSMPSHLFELLIGEINRRKDLELFGWVPHREIGSEKDSVGAVYPAELFCAARSKVCHGARYVQEAVFVLEVFHGKVVDRPAAEMCRIDAEVGEGA